MVLAAFSVVVSRPSALALRLSNIDFYFNLWIIGASAQKHQNFSNLLRSIGVLTPLIS